MPVPYVLISEPPANNVHLTAAFAQMHVTAFNNSGADATVKASCTHDIGPHKHNFDDIVLGSDPDAVHLLIYVMPHKANGGTHKLDVSMTAGATYADDRSGIVMDPPDCPDDGIHEKSYEFLIEKKAFNFPGHDYLPKKLLEQAPVYIKAEKGGVSDVEGKVAGGPKELDLAMWKRPPQFLGTTAQPTVLFPKTKLTENKTWSLPVDTSDQQHGSALVMEFTLQGKTYPVRFVRPVMDPAQEDKQASKPGKGVYVFKIARPK